MPRPLAEPRKPVPALAFVWKTIVSLGLYPVFWLAVRCPSLHRKAIVLRGRHLDDPAANPSSWPWIRAAWIAWFGTLALALFGLLVASGFLFPLMRLSHSHTWALVLLYTGMVLPQLIVLIELLHLVGHTLYPERAFTYVRSRYVVAVGRATGWVVALRDRRLAALK